MFTNFAVRPLFALFYVLPWFNLFMCNEWFGDWISRTQFVLQLCRTFTDLSHNYPRQNVLCFIQLPLPKPVATIAAEDTVLLRLHASVVIIQQFYVFIETSMIPRVGKRDIDNKFDAEISLYPTNCAKRLTGFRHFGEVNYRYPPRVVHWVNDCIAYKIWWAHKLLSKTIITYRHRGSLAIPLFLGRCHTRFYSVLWYLANVSWQCEIAVISYLLGIDFVCGNSHRQAETLHLYCEHFNWY